MTLIRLHLSCFFDAIKARITCMSNIRLPCTPIQSRPFLGALYIGLSLDLAFYICLLCPSD